MKIILKFYNLMVWTVLNPNMAT